VRLTRAWLAFVVGLAATPCQAGEDGPRGLSGTVGVGPLFVPKYVGGRSWEMLPVPIAFVDYNEWLYVNLFRAGAYVWGSQDKKTGVSLSLEPRLGFKSGDGPRLAGMATRRPSLSAGPTLDWTGAVGSASVGYFRDFTHASGGGYFDALFNRPFVKDARWDISGTVELSRVDRRVVSYYFGVRPDEALAARPAYEPGATTNLTLWLTGQYNITKRYALMFGANTTRLGAAAASSPIVEQRMSPLLYLALGINL
jgi:outer membrane scaffolding protein for murein synthesis (MipA/OmpV family)